jgi:hypothetical protein
LTEAISSRRHGDLDRRRARLAARRLSLPAQLSALVVLTHAGPAPRARDDALSVILQHAGIGTLTLDLLTGAEERFADRHAMSRCSPGACSMALALLKQRMLLGELPTLPIGLCAAGDCSPVVLRVAALRDHDIYAVVCRGGLIDLAGMLYLRSLTVAVAASRRRGRRARRREQPASPERSQLPSRELRLLPANTHSPDSAAAFELVARETARWFVQRLAGD